MKQRVTRPKEAGLTRPTAWHTEDSEGRFHCQDTLLVGGYAGITSVEGDLAQSIKI